MLIRRAGTVIGIMLIPLALLGVKILIDREFDDNRRLRATVETSVEARAALSDLLALHLDAETGVRGYVLTGRDEFLEPYEAAIQRREGLFERLDAAMRGDARSSRDLTQLRATSGRKMALARATVADMQANRQEAARATIASGAGKRAMDAIRQEIAALDAAQAPRLEAVTAHGQGQRANLEFTITMLLVGIALLLAGAAALIGRTSRERLEALSRANRMAARQAAMFDGAVDGMLLLDDAGNIRGTNPSIFRMFGYREEELLGRHNTELMAEPFDLKTSRAWLESVGSAGEHGAGRRQEFTGLRADGSTFETEVAISLVPDQGERRYVAAIRDITDFKHAEAMKSEFVSTVSHELRTPLTSIGGSLGLLASGAVGKLNDKADRLVAIAHSNCERLIRLINDILDIEKIESANMHFADEELDICQLVLRTSAANGPFADGRGVSLATEGCDGRIMVRGDADRLEQALTNLVSNAIKYSPPGETVEVAALTEGKWVVVEVRDRGAGVPMEFRGRIFGKFAMADGSDSRQRGGTGLGLSIAREIAERHRGSIDFHDRDGGGTVFCLRVPIFEPDRVEARGRRGLPLVLHVDDDRDCLSVTRSAFEQVARIVSVASIEEAREVIASRPLAGAIVDVGLRDDDGTELIPLLRAQDESMPIVLFSAIDDQHVDAAADAVLIKSRSTIQDLVATVSKLLREKGGGGR